MDFFYQSTSAVNTRVDYNNPVHVKLLEMLCTIKHPTRAERVRANNLMKKAGMKAGYATDMLPNVRWSSDLSIVVRDEAGLITDYISHGWE